MIFVDAADHAHARRWTFRQSRRSTVSPGTRDVLIVAEGLHPAASTDVPALIDALATHVGGLSGRSAPARGADRRGAAARVLGLSAPPPAGPSVRSIVALSLPAAAAVAGVRQPLRRRGARITSASRSRSLSSLLVYSGALQFAIVALLGAGATTLPLLLTAGVLNLRHLVLGAALRSRSRAARCDGRCWPSSWRTRPSGSPSRPATRPSRGRSARPPSARCSTPG